MSNEDILAGLGEIVEEVAGVAAADVTADKSFTDDLDIDSLSMVEIAVQAEDKFGVKIPDDELANLKTVGDAVDYIAEQPSLGRLATPATRSPGTQHPVTHHELRPRRRRHRYRRHHADRWHRAGNLAGHAGRRGRRQAATPSLGRRYDLPVRIYAPLAVEPTEVLARVEARRLDRCQQVALVAAREAWARRRAAGDADWTAAGRGGRHRHRRGADPARPGRHPGDDGRPQGGGADRPDADAQRSGRRGRAVGQGARAACTPRCRPARPAPRRSPGRTG